MIYILYNTFLKLNLVINLRIAIVIKLFFLFFLIFVQTGCIKTIRVSGHLFEESEIQALQNAKNKTDVENTLGTPTSVSDFGQETWYYITTKKETIAFLPDKILEQNIIAISFNKDSVDTISRYTEKDSNTPHLTSEYTPTKGNDSSAAQQLFGNVGRFNENKQKDPELPRSGF